MSEENSTSPPSSPRGATRNNLPSCFNDYKKMTLAAALSTMTFSVLCVGFLVNDLMDITTSMESLERQHFSDKESKDSSTHRSSRSQALQDEESAREELRELTVTKVLYTVLICELVLLLISSVSLLKGVFQKKQSLVITWMLIVLATVIFAGAVITRDIYINLSKEELTGIYTRGRPLSGKSSAKLGFYAFFVIMEALYIRFVIRAFKEIRSRRRGRDNMACFDPRHPDRRIFTIADNIELQRPDTLFKLPSYEEVTSGSSEGTSPKPDPPPYEPPPYKP